jgi:hypothetical protein
VEITCRVYRPRRPRESPLFRLVEQHLEELLRAWPTRFDRQHGPLRPVVERVLHEFLGCGLLEHGFARLWCAYCRRSILVRMGEVYRATAELDRDVAIKALPAELAQDPERSPSRSRLPRRSRKRTSTESSPAT